MKKMLSIIFACISFNCFGAISHDLFKSGIFGEYVEGRGKRLVIIMKKIEQEQTKDSRRMEILKTNFSIEADLTEESLMSCLNSCEDSIERELKQANPNWQFLYQQQEFCILLSDTLEQFREVVKEVLSQEQPIDFS